jgi:hypothetical protein
MSGPAFCFAVCDVGEQLLGNRPGASSMVIAMISPLTTAFSKPKSQRVRKRFSDLFPQGADTLDLVEQAIGDAGREASWIMLGQKLLGTEDQIISPIRARSKFPNELLCQGSFQSI